MRSLAGCVAVQETDSLFLLPMLLRGDPKSPLPVCPRCTAVDSASSVSGVGWWRLCIQVCREISKKDVTKWFAANDTSSIIDNHNGPLKGGIIDLGDAVRIDGELRAQARLNLNEAMRLG
jgi:hypothetical protein